MTRAVFVISQGQFGGDERPRGESLRKRFALKLREGPYRSLPLLVGTRLTLDGLFSAASTPIAAIEVSLQRSPRSPISALLKSLFCRSR